MEAIAQYLTGKTNDADALKEAVSQLSSDDIDLIWRRAQSILDEIEEKEQ